MRRAERELADPAALERILRRAQVLFLALRDEPAPYVLPVCFGFEDGMIYIHSAAAGTKIDLISRDPMVGFSASTEMTVTPADSPCGFSSKAESVVGTGAAEILTDEARRRHGLDLIMRHYAGRGTPWTFSGTSFPAYEPASFARTCVIAVRVGTMRGKRTG
jgi:nitroimidazol reductase NimA-like FMN-containing flavoprotein (pyridoxamine 5'-phosphate oxidase superfamily)